MRNKLMKFKVALLGLMAAVAATPAKAAMTVPEEVTEAFTDAGTAVGVVIGAGLLVSVAWLIGRIAKKGLSRFGAG